MNEMKQSVWMDDYNRQGNTDSWMEAGTANVQAPGGERKPGSGEASGKGSMMPGAGDSASAAGGMSGTGGSSLAAGGMSGTGGSSLAAGGMSGIGGSASAAGGMSGTGGSASAAGGVSGGGGPVSKTGGQDHAGNGQATGNASAAADQFAWGNSTHVDTEETKRMKANFGFFAPAAFLYAVFYVACMFRNGSGITYPFFVGGSLLFLCLSLPKLGITLKKGSVFYMAAMILLGISTFCTDDARIIFFNKLGVFLLMMSLLLKQCYNTSNWKLGKFLGSICVLVVASLGELGRPFSDAAAYRKNGINKTDRKIWYVALGLLIGVPLMLVVLLLLASADAVFRQMTKYLLQNITLYNIFSVLFQIALVFLITYALIAYLCRRRIKEEVTDRRTGEPVLAITVTGLLTLLYLLFSGIQIAGLFLGQLQLPVGYTYAMYAREGFFQLLVVSFLNLVIVLVCLSFFRESNLLRSILAAMSFCTFVMIASSAMRMIIYIRYYYLTFLRILVLWGLAVLAVLFVGILINIFQEQFPLFRYSVAVVAVLYLALSFAHPDYIIARVNVANAVHGTSVSGRSVDGGSFFLARQPYQDYAYLRHLSADAAPVLVPYLKELGYEMEAFYAENAVAYAREQGITDKSDVDGFGYSWLMYMQDRTENFGLRTFNVSRYLMLRKIRY